MDPCKEATYKVVSNRFIGYPCNIAYDYSDVFSSMQYNFNNVGDPEVPSLYQLHTKAEEIEVLKFFERLWHFDENNSWGCTTNSGTEGNLQGLFIGREVFPNGILYASEDAHYSIFKIARILRMEICKIQSLENGEMDYRDFDAKLNPNLPAIVVVNLGTTMKGAIDNPREIYRILCKHKKQNDYYMHADGALMGFVLPFLESDLFFKKCLHSISISGHKFLGVPFPCGIFMMEKRFLERVNQRIEYTGSIDNTIAGSRNGHSALFLHHMIQQKGYTGFRKDILDCIDNAEYLLQAMHDNNIPAWRNNNSITVVFDRPSQAIVEKWQLASQKQLSHVVVMPHVTRPRLDSFLRDLKQRPQAHCHLRI